MCVGEHDEAEGQAGAHRSPDTAQEQEAGSQHTGGASSSLVRCDEPRRKRSMDEEAARSVNCGVCTGSRNLSNSSHDAATARSGARDRHGELPLRDSQLTQPPGSNEEEGCALRTSRAWTALPDHALLRGALLVLSTILAVLMPLAPRARGALTHLRAPFTISLASLLPHARAVHQDVSSSLTAFPEAVLSEEVFGLCCTSGEKSAVLDVVLRFPLSLSQMQVASQPSLVFQVSG